MDDNGPYTEIRIKRAKDLTDKDVFRFSDSVTRVSGPSVNPWRMIWNVFRSEAGILKEFGNIPGEISKEWRESLEDGTNMGGFVIVRILIQENSDISEIEDKFLLMWNYDLVEVQSLPSER